MMLPTHALVGLAIGAPLLWLAPESATAALIGGLCGGIWPDLDLYVGHRRTLHYPTGYSLAAIPAVIVAAVVGSPLAIGLAVAVVAAAAHCRMDRYGGGLELRPWENTSERAVYDHVAGEWRAPKRWVRYDGAPEDVGLSLLVGLPLAAVVPQTFRWLVVVAIIVAIGYGLLRRWLAALAPALAEFVPDPVDEYVPERYRRDDQ
ncbi:metal-dependent hydrolase [Halonotius roseus]|uniref:Metal-dependent hydrolase n=1 Tax=Halonotius roseus TaxID=2511997 RepID=A0A544QM87_9EURY|nr:metal-dependent hydrolase [Halonotius roseus]TQQ79706.1 metal-dependent hydrolase [Halonotius roseus]